jgi:hypothetical protein
MQHPRAPKEFVAGNDEIPSIEDVILFTNWEEGQARQTRRVHPQPPTGPIAAVEMDHFLAGGVTLLHFTFTSHQRRALTRFDIYKIVHRPHTPQGARRRRRGGIRSYFGEVS